VKLVFKKAGKPNLEVDAAPGARLIDLCDQHRSPVPFSCRGTSCGTCCVRVHEGAALLDDAGDEELNLVEALGYSGDTHRLACTAKLRSGPDAGASARVVLEPENDD
jgi:ferredoxin